MAAIEKRAGRRGITYRIMVSMGYGADGRQVRKTTTFTPPDGVAEGKSRKLAEAFARDFEKQCAGITSLRENMKVSELTAWYFKEIAPSKLKGTTLYGKRNLIELYILPHIGHLKIKDVNTVRLDELWNTLAVSGRTSKRCVLADKSALLSGSCKRLARMAGISESTVYTVYRGGHVSESSAVKMAEAMGRKLRDVFAPLDACPGGLDAVSVIDIRRALSSIFATAVKKEIVIRNPVTHSTPPKAVKKEKPFLDDNQCKQLLSVFEGLENIQLRTMLTVLMYTGMRSGELCALKWDDLNIDGGTVYIRHTLARLNGEYKRQSPKTPSSERAISVPAEIIRLLKEHREWQDGYKTALGSRWTETGAVFTGEYGNWYNCTYLNTAFKKIIKEYGLPDVHIHDLRHACASLLINSGVPVKIVSEHLGHADTRTTEQVYAHLFAATRTKASEAISRVLGK